MSAPLHSSSIDPEGRSQQDIARRLTREGIPTKRGHGPWLQGTVGKLLRSRVPLGERQFKGEWAKANYPAIIDEASWEQAQVLLTANTKAKGGRGGRGRAPRAGHIFSGRDLRCGCCGGAMVPRSVPTQVYYCLTHKRDSTACPMTPRPRPAIDSAVLSYFRQSALDLESTQQRIVDAHQRRHAGATAQRRAAERDAMAAEERLRRVTRDYQDGSLPVESYNEQRPALLTESEAAERLVTDAIAYERRVHDEANSSDAEEATLRRLGAIQDAVAGLSEDPESVDAFRATLRRLFSGFTLHWFDRAAQGQATRPLPDYWQPELLLVGGLYIEPHVREDALVRPVGPHADDRWPELQRVALDGPLAEPENNHISATQM